MQEGVGGMPELQRAELNRRIVKQGLFARDYKQIGYDNRTTGIETNTAPELRKELDHICTFYGILRRS